MRSIDITGVDRTDDDATSAVRWCQPRLASACGDGGGAPIVDAVAFPSASGSVSSCGVSFWFVDLKVHMPERCQFDLASLDVDVGSGNVTGRVSVRPVTVAFYSSDPNVRAVAAGGVRYVSMLVADFETTVRITATSAEGETMWHHDYPGDGPAGLAAVNGVVVGAWPAVVTDQSTVPLTVTAFDASTGRVLWSTEIEATGTWADRRLGEHQEMFTPVLSAYPPHVDVVAPGTPSHGLVSVAIIDDQFLCHEPMTSS